MAELILVHRLQYWYKNSNQLFRVPEGLHVKVHSATFRVQCIQLAPAHWAWGQGWSFRHRIWSNCSGCTSSQSLPLGVVKAVSRLAGCCSLAPGFISHLNAHAMHTL